MEAFFTRARANEGVKLPLALPDGSPTEHWIRIRGIDSDQFKQAETEARRHAFELADIKDPVELQQAVSNDKLKLLAALVIDWSFADRPCTQENIFALLREAPQIADEIDRLSARRRLFFKQGSTPSTSSPAQSSS